MSPAITPQESAQEAHAISDAIDEAAKREDWPAVVAACRQALEHPCAKHAFYVADIWTGLAEAFVLQQDYDQAIAALQAAVAAGHRAWPHPDTDIARLHLLAGRRAEADAVFASVRERTPDDVWMYHSAGAGYQGVGDHETALAWLSDGIQLGLRTGDPDGLVGELEEARFASLKALGRAPDALSATARSFAQAWVRPAPGTWSPPPWPEEPSAARAGDSQAPDPRAGDSQAPDPRAGDPQAGDPQAGDPQAGDPQAGDPQAGDPQAGDAGASAATAACEHCGWAPVTLDPGEAARRRDPRGGSRPMAVAFFTADEWPRAVASWPHLLEEMPADHFAYVRELQSRILQISQATGARLVMVPMSFGGLLAFCEANPKLNPGSGEARAEYAASLVHEGHGRSWPPERNETCWCGSGRKYKACCGTVEAPPSPPA